MRLSGSEVEQATGGRWRDQAPDVINEVVTDTRGFKPGQTFLALRGPRFDGHLFAAAVADQARALIGDTEGVKLWDDLDTCQLEVADTLQALGDIAHAWRLQLESTTVIAISGSYGKTSLRSLLEHGFTALGFNVAATRANLNNLVGVPQTLLTILADADIALVECGISEPGEMSRLAAIVQPDVALLTGFAAAHTEGLGGLEGVVREKSALLEHLAPDAWCALGAGVRKQLELQGIRLPEAVLDADAPGSVCWQLDGRDLQLFNDTESASIELALPARHWAANVALAAGTMLRLLKQRQRKGSLAGIAEILASWRPPAGRMHLQRGCSGCNIIDDSYNANPASMQAALDTLAAMDGRRVAILGDMAELGEGSESAHAGLRLDGLDAVYLVGPKMKALAAGNPEVVWFASTAEAVARLSGYAFDENDTVLVKASRSMGLEAVVAMLLGRGESVEVAHAL